jgi:hypothetical protein
MLTYDPIAQLNHYPLPGGYARFGTNPYGEPLYRVVFGPSRRYLVVGEWADGSNCAQWVRKYKHLQPENVWVLEKWRSGIELHPQGKEDWNISRLILGPWPERGDYEICEPLACNPSDANIEKLISWVELGRSHSFNEIRQWHVNDAARIKKENRDKAEQIIRNALPAWGSRPFAGAHGRRVTPMQDLQYAEDLGLPTRPGMSTTPNNN